MKKILIPVTVLILLIVGSYGLFGFMIKKNFDQGMAEISAQIPSHIDVTYKQGFLSSTVDLSIKIPIDDADVDFDFIITTHHTIHHGPFVLHAMNNGHPSYLPVLAYTDGTLFYELKGDIEPEIAQGVKAASLTKINGYIPFMGNSRIDFSGEPLSKDFEMEGSLMSVDWQGFSGSIDLLGSMRNFRYEFLAPGLTIANDGPENVSISTITSKGTARTGSFDIGLGEYHAGIKNISITLSSEPGDQIVVDNMRLKLRADEQDGLLTISELFDIASFSFNNKTYGPANTTVHLRNLDAKTLSAMNQEYIAIQKDNSHDPQAMQDQLMQMVSTHGTTLLSKSPEFEFENISLETSEGIGAAKLKISFNGDGEVVMNPFFLLGRLSAEASFGADERFLAVLAKEITKEAMCDDDTDPVCDQQAAQASNDQLQQFVTNGQLVLHNGRYTANIDYKDGAATLNGTPMPLF